MSGYRNDPERTAEAIDAEGWIHTGDVGTIDEDGYLRIVDRKKELIISSAGKNMSPADIEKRGQGRLSAGRRGRDDRRRPALQHGPRRTRPDATAALTAAHEINDTTPSSLAENPQVRAIGEQGIERANQTLSRVEQIKKHTLLPAVWEPGGEELTPTMKLWRRTIADKYTNEITAMYESPPRP
jgi:long-chain acyl-CoA synthetase